MALGKTAHHHGRNRIIQSFPNSELHSISLVNEGPMTVLLDTSKLF